MKGSWVHALFHIVCILVITIHLLFKLLTIDNDDDVDDDDDDERSESMEDTMDNVWLLIKLSIVGCAFHSLMFNHAVPTAPEEIKKDGTLIEVV